MKISVITVCYNCQTDIEKTILSVINQTFKNIEYIIIDGGSTDGTIDIIKKYNDKITYWISEPDKGIYDAMNKGIKMATGEWINFMNAGDIFYNNTVLSSIQFDKYQQNDIIYGSVEYDYGFTKRIAAPLPLKKILKQMCFSHQSTFVKTDLMKKELFDVRYKIIADYAFLLSQYKANKKFEEIPLTIATYEKRNGVSSDPNFKSFKKRLEELRKLGIHHNILYAYSIFTLKKIILFICPNYLLKKIYQLKK